MLPLEHLDRIQITFDGENCETGQPVQATTEPHHFTTIIVIAEVPFTTVMETYWYPLTPTAISGKIRSFIGRAKTPA